MKFHYTNLETCHEATGLVIVIDVIRAFTSAAFAFASGVEKIHPVSSIEEALVLKQQDGNMLACGEVKGIPIDGFDFGNSPTQILELDLRGRTVVQRTSAGTQGITRSLKADDIFAASFVVAQATVDHVHKLAPERITFVVTGESYNGGDEDLACAHYLEALFKGKCPDPMPYLERVRTSEDAKMFLEPDQSQFPASDIAHCTSLDKFDFAMRVTKENEQLVMHAVKP